MMPYLILTQTDDAGACADGSYCNPGPLNGVVVNKKASQGGTRGSAVQSVVPDNLLTFPVCMNLDCAVPDGYDWKAGTWTFRLHVTMGNINVFLGTVSLCRVDSTCVNQATIGSKNPNTQLPVADVYMVQITGIAQTPNPGDRVMIAVAFDGSGVHGAGVSVKLDQDVETPFGSTPDVHGAL